MAWSNFTLQPITLWFVLKQTETTSTARSRTRTKENRTVKGWIHRKIHKTTKLKLFFCLPEFRGETWRNTLYMKEEVVGVTEGTWQTNGCRRDTASCFLMKLPTEHSASACKCLFPLRRSAERRFHPDWVQFPLWRENVNVSFTPVWSFIMIKQFILRKKGRRETRAVASFIACPVSFTRLWFSIMLLSAAVKPPGPAPKQISHILLFLPLSFFFISFLSALPLSSLLLAYSFFTCDCRPVKVILNQSNPL